LKRSWSRVHLLLTIAAGLLFLLMGGALFGVVERLRSGVRIFG
jgi:hypothetical protein